VIVWAIPALAAAAYYVLAIIAALRWRKRPYAGGRLPPVSVLKPMYGTDPHLYEALRSYAAQDYPDFEILFGLGNPADPALADIERLRAEFPVRAIRIIVTKPDAPNAKAAVLAKLAAEARYPILIVSDDDIVADPGYLRSVVESFQKPRTGLVTCLYRAHARSLPSLIESLGIATEFAPSVLVARLLGVVDFALGSTMALRTQTLREAGGFEAVANFLADDYQLGRNVTAAGHRIEFASTVVETGAGDVSWSQLWRHQLRWSRTIRVSRSAGYYGSVVTHATVWAVLAWAGGQSKAAAVAIALRLIAGVMVGGLILKDRKIWWWFWLIPLRDLFGFAVWLGGCFGSTVYWRGRRLRLRRDGRITGEL
jgi:ceramide glucosyltransferase